MSNLSRVFAVKIGITAVLWFGPLLFAPVGLIERIGFPVGSAAILLRLLGMAYGSLLVSYGFGFIAARHEEYPRGSVWTGIISNGGACLLLSLGGVQGMWTDWGSMARLIMWISLVATGLITAGLVAFGPCAQHSRLGG